MMPIPCSDWLSIYSISLKVVVSIRSWLVTMRDDMSAGERPENCHATAITGMRLFEKDIDGRALRGNRARNRDHDRHDDEG